MLYKIRIKKPIYNHCRRIQYVAVEFFQRVCLLNQKRIICGKEAFLISDLFENIKHLCEENGIEKSIITTLKKKIIDIFPEEVSFYPNGKYLTTH